MVHLEKQHTVRIKECVCAIRAGSNLGAACALEAAAAAGMSGRGGAHKWARQRSLRGIAPAFHQVSERLEGIRWGQCGLQDARSLEETRGNAHAVWRIKAPRL